MNTMSETTKRRGLSNTKKLKLFSWLRSIRLTCKNGYMQDYDANRILDKLATHLHQEVIRGKIEEIELCKIAISKSWGMNHCETRLTKLKEEQNGKW